MIVYFPGSFKPPHKGHFAVVEKIAKSPNVDKIYIIIGVKPRECDGYEIIAEQSKAVWKLYIETCIPVEQQSKIVPVISNYPGPIYHVYKDIEKKIKQNKQNKKNKMEKYILIKSKKDAENTRFELFNSFIKQGISITPFIMPDVKNIHATDFRCIVRNSVKDKKITENETEKIMHFLPPNFPKSLIESRFIPIFTQKIKSSIYLERMKRMKQSKHLKHSKYSKHKKHLKPSNHAKKITKKITK